MKFRTPYTEHRSKPCCSGSRYRKTYVRSVGEDGTLIESGVENVYDTIQKAGDGRCIADLIYRAEHGDQTAIGEVVDSFVDLSHAPTDIIEAHQMLVDARNKYNSLPLEVRSKFGNSFTTFLEACGTGKAQDLLTKVDPGSNKVDALTPEQRSQILSIINGGSHNE